MTNGKIVNKTTGLEIPVKDFFECASYCYVEMEGCEFAMPFLQSEWDFVADRPALPTEPGLYKANPKHTFPEHENLLLLSSSGKWSWLDDSYEGSLTPADLKFLERRYSETITRVEV